LPGNISLNMVQHATIDKAVFFMSTAPPPMLLTDQSSLSLTRGTCFLFSLRRATTEGCVFCVWSVPRGYERIREWDLTGLEPRSSEGTTVWPEEDLVRDVTCAVVHRDWKLVRLL
jgi:hypothetical protein